MTRSLGLFFASILLGGCIGAEALSQVSAGYVGCPAEEIEISNDEAGFAQRTWDASCRGRMFHCAAVNKAGMSCTEDRPALTAAKVAASPEASQSKPPAPHSWKRFVAKDCGVAFLLPGDPEEERETVKTRVGPMATYSATVDLGAGAVFVGCSTLPKKAMALDKTLDGMRDGALQEMGGEFVSERDASVGSFEGRHVRFNVTGEGGRLRVLRSGREIVTVGLLPSKAFTNAEVKRFLETIEESAPSDGGAL